MIEIDLPYPPSLNQYYRHVGHRVLISRKGREYRKRVVSILAWMGVEKMEGPLELWLEAFPPDRRRRDLDNLNKAVWDALQHGGLYNDDFQIKEFHASMREVVKGGALIVRIEKKK